ncbi:alcohol dehydrogenase catalytic domain-containing protein [Streptomyces sp. DSM 44917]|uniref:alcohol dehydrogenase n=1 Tax=Streptomyces boetiae TaxID=3075541 RepID=A0ABU2L913_9ACTN|nr:alcohol dehydrogenase catalytic domain-containing protein [Streptomyces sp. DSM 44917]MDT0307992.1 alcohol dehydrogenase catalytic domain-containing protein [Streptomyces sp. DSM 44917]
MPATTTMRAAQAVAPGAPFALHDLPVPEPGPGQVRVRVHACGVCGGDNVARNAALATTLPRVPGHEIAGRIDALGEGVTAWRTGDRVGIGWHGGSCFTCPACRSGDFSNCAHRQAVGSTYDGGYAEYTVAPQDALARIPDALSFEEAAPLMCAGLTTFNSLRASGARPGDTVAMHGIGGLGHLALQFADRMGFRTVAISRGRDKEKAARELGADEYIDSTAGSAGEALARLGGAAAILAGVADAEAQADLIQGLAPNGRLLIVGPAHEPLAVGADPLILGRRQIQGWYSGHAKDAEDTLAFAALKGVRPRIQSFPLERAEEAFRTMGRARYRNVILP